MERMMEREVEDGKKHRQAKKKKTVTGKKIEQAEKTTRRGIERCKVRRR